MDPIAGFRIRTATIHDYFALRSIFAEAEAFHRHALPEIFRAPADGFPSPELFESIVLGADSDILFAEFGTEALGFVATRIDATPDEDILVPRRFAMVDMLAVRTDYRRQGIGRALMVATHNWAHERDLRIVQLTVWEFNHDAITFYEALGYRSMSRLMESTFTASHGADTTYPQS